MTGWTTALRWLAAWLLLLGPLSGAARADVPAVAAAADLRFALGELAERFRQETGKAVKLAFGSSGTFTHQIEQGAPFELFLSADEGFVFRLADAGLTADRGVLYAIGRVVVFAPHDSALLVDGELQGLRAALASGAVRRFAIANPEHAPYGRAARAVLQHAGLWQDLENRLVLGENASQAMQFAAAGSSQGGIVPLSLSKAPEVAALGRFALIPAEWHRAEPLRQRMVLTRRAGDTARAFHAYLQTPAAREVLVRYGFVLPDDAGP
jgi:molybdate transport system substrate-binding protein